MGTLRRELRGVDAPLALNSGDGSPGRRRGKTWHHVAVLTRLGEVSKNARSAYVGALRSLTAAYSDVVRAAGAREAVEEQVARLAGNRVDRGAQRCAKISGTGPTELVNFPQLPDTVCVICNARDLHMNA